MRTQLTTIFLFFIIAPYALSQVISEIVIQDNKRTKTGYITSLIDLKVGQSLDSLTLKSDVLRLKREAGIAHAYYQVHLTDQGYKIVYGVEENFTIIPSFNFYTTNDDEVAYRIGIAEFNALGRGISIGSHYLRDIYDSYGAGIRAPYLFNKHIGLAVNYQNLTTEEPVFFNEGTALYRYNNNSIELSGLYQFNLKNRVELGFSLFTEKYDYKSGTISNQAPLNLDVDKHLLKFIYEYNGVDFYYQYSEGFRNVFNAQYVESTNRTLPSFLIVRNDLTYFKRIKKRGNWATRLTLGLATNDESPFAPFAVDNNLNVRGVGNLIDRGTGSVVINTEYRHSIIDKEWFVLQGNAFIDAGTWRNPGGSFRDFTNSNNVRVYPGLGVRFMHKRIFNAILRIDYGVGITPGSTQGFVFGIGQYF
nr:BamA/TamA family outer membrane protein [Nonlabens ulvanivorans]